jgi:hypothetical protein
METILQITAATRELYIKFLNDISIEDLGKIPSGFNNSIWWNIAHVAVTQQLLVYGLSGLEPHLSKSFIDSYRKGTAPVKAPTLEEVETLKSALKELIVRTKEDVQKGIFSTYNPYVTSAGVTLNNVSDAMAFNLVHEGIHIGAIIALKKALRG